MIASNITSITGVDGAKAVPDIFKKPEPASETREVLSKENQLSQDSGGVRKKESPEKTLTVEEYVRSYFSDIPIMIEIARCESRFRQYDDFGNVLSGVENNLDKGVMQINQYYHGYDSERLGFDILTLEGNTAYARYLFERSGVAPWSSSSPCWSKTVAYSNYTNELALGR